MFLKLLILLLRTRFSKSFMLIVCLVFVYSLIALGLGFASGGIIPQYYLGFIFSVFLLPATLFGGISINEADRDFLFTSSIRNRDLIPSFYIAQAVASSIIFVSATFVYLSMLTTKPYFLWMGIVSVVAMSFLPISMSLFMAGKHILIKVSASILEVLWIFSSFAGYNFGPLYFLNENSGSLISMGILVSITVIVTGLAFMSINAESLPFTFYSLSEKNRNYFTRNHKFSGMKSTNAILKLNFSQIDFTSRMASVGNIRVRVNRISVYAMFLIMCLFSLIFYLIVHYYLFRNPFDLFIASAYVAWFLILALSTGTMSKERAWLSLSAMSIDGYLRLILISKILQSIFISLPFFVVFMIMSLQGMMPYEYSLLFLCIVPAFSGINFILSFLRKPYQVLQEDILPAIYNSSQFMTVPISIVNLFFIFIVMLFSFSFYIVFPAAIVILALVIHSKSYWRDSIYRWVEIGYM